MAIRVQFYTLKKYENSTKLPTSSDPHAYYDCIIKDSTSIFYPTIKLNKGAENSSAPTFNYCYISDFGRYYFITDWSWDNGIWIASLKVDVLATYKTDIGNSSLYALRAANSYDGSIVDQLYPAKAGCSFATESLSGGRPFGNVMQGCFVMGIVSKDPDFGSVKYIALSRTNMQAFIAQLLDDAILTGNGFNAADASLALQKSLIDPLQYIKSCVYIPYPPASLTDSLDVISSFDIWDWNIPLAGYEVKYAQPYNAYTGSIDIPKHPQTSSRGKYVNQAPYTTLALQAPPFGLIDLDTTALVDATSLSIGCYVDLPTGLGILTLSNGSIILNRIEAQLGVPVQLSQVLHDYAGAITGAVGAIGSAVGGAMSGNIAGAVTGFVNGAIGSAIAAKYPTAQSLGSGGSYAQLTGNWNIYAQFFSMVDDDITHNGRPCCEMVTPANIGGYMLIQDGDVSISGTHEEAQEIKRYLETGFFYE